MNFIESVKAGFANWNDFLTRASRSEFWYWLAFAVGVVIAAGVVDWGLFARNNIQFTADGLPVVSGPVSPISMIAAIVLLIPTLAVSARRLHDIDKSAWWLLLVIVPFIAYMALGVSLVNSDVARQMVEGVVPATVPWQATGLSIASFALLVASAWLLVWYMQPGMPGLNRYGPGRVPGFFAPRTPAATQTRMPPAE